MGIKTYESESRTNITDILWVIYGIVAEPDVTIAEIQRCRENREHLHYFAKIKPRGVGEKTNTTTTY